MFRASTCPSSGGKFQSEDTRCCVSTIFPPEDGHVEDNSVTNILLMNKENCAIKLVDEIILLSYI